MKCKYTYTIVDKCSGASTTPEKSNMELFVALVNDFQPLINVTKNTMEDAFGVLDTSLTCKNIAIYYFYIVVEYLLKEQVISYIPFKFHDNSNKGQYC